MARTKNRCELSTFSLVGTEYSGSLSSKLGVAAVEGWIELCVIGAIAWRGGLRSLKLATDTSDEVNKNSNR